MSIEPYSDYSRAKAMREVKALKLLQLFESGKLVNMIQDQIISGEHAGYEFYSQDFVDDVEEYLRDAF